MLGGPPLPQKYHITSRSSFFPICILLSARAILSLLGTTLVRAGLVPTTTDPLLRPYFGIDPVTQGLPGLFLGVWQRFDAIHYLRIASSGYSAIALSAYFPLYPFLVRIVGMAIGQNYLLASILVSNIAALLAIIVFYNLVIDETGDQGIAQRSTIHLVFFPTAFFLLAPYPESLALLFCLIAFREARHGRWSTAAVAGFACALTRSQGVLLTFAFIVEAFRQLRSSTRPSIQLALAVIAPVLGLTTFFAARWASGFPPLHTVIYDYWQRVTTLPFSSVLATFQRIFACDAMPIEYLDLLIVLVALALGVLVVKRLPLAYSAYYWSVILFNLSQNRLVQPISSQGRYALVLFPAFIVLGQLSASPLINRIILYLSFPLWLFLAGQFIMWGWVG